ncbi:MAG: hypothetical protein J6C03_00765 [Clostridia bacterium]|nr:hypothetical protein [Clostridia bacterium]
MESIFIKLLNMSISAGWLVLVVIAVRFLFKKAPKWVMCLLWAMVALRLVFPFSIESALSLIPSTETVPDEFLFPGIPEIHTGVNSLNSVINPIIGETLAPNPMTSANPSQILTAIVSRVWILGVIVMALYAIISYFRIRFKVRISAPKEKGIYITDGINTPFILGIIRPKIYLPSEMAEDNTDYVIAHEKAHLSRLDHLWKPLGYLLLSIYWFNVLMWVAYILLCRDIEVACDEKVIRLLGEENKKAYSEALLSCSVPRRMIAACPLAFGEVGVKARIKSVLDYKKPAFWIIIAALVVSVVVAVCFLTDPPSQILPDTVSIVDSGSELDGVSIEIKEIDLTSAQPYIEVVWKNKTVKGVSFGTPFDILYDNNGTWDDCRATESVWHAILHLLNPVSEREVKYNLYHIDMSKEGLYRIEVKCSIDDKKEYKLWVDFELREGVPFTTVKQYKAKETVYDSPVYSSVITPDMAPLWKISVVSNDLFLEEKGRSDVDWIALGAMVETTLSKKNFDDRLNTVPSWSEDHSLEKLKKENKRVWEAAFYSDYSAYDLYMLLEQENGDMYLCMGSQGENHDLENASFRCIFLLESVDVGSEENVTVRPSLIYNGKHYVDIYAAESKLPDNFSYAGVISPEMANNTGLEGMRYFTNEDDDYYFYVEHIVDGKTMYKMWDAGRTYAAQANVMRYICKDTVDFVAPSVTLYPDSHKFMFTYSGFSSNIPIGTYELTEEKLTLNVSGSDDVYVFKVNGNNLYFDAESSADLPKYKYSKESEPQHPFEDGANFSRVFDLQHSYDLIKEVGEGDIDGDGKIERLQIGPGPTSGIYTFTVTATENGEKEYFNIFQSEFLYTAFMRDKSGKLYLRAETQMAEATVHMYEITVEDGNIVLSENGEKMAYWGEQGLDSSWLTRYEE